MKIKRPQAQLKSSLSSLLALTAACVSLFGCELTQKKIDAKMASVSSGSSSSGSQTGTSPAYNAPAPSAPVDVPVNISSTGTAGIRDFVQIVPAMSAVTGVPMSNTAVQKYYSSAITRMSVDGSGTAISSALLATYTTMASIFCQQLVAKELSPGPRVIFADLDFTKGPAGLTPAVRTALLKKLTQQFWGRDPSAGESTTFNTMLDEISAPLNGVTGIYGTANERTKVIALSACTTILSSLDFLKN
jgi:hypothetical protein